jgi:opacity protein-like surface antigen
LNRLLLFGLLLFFSISGFSFGKKDSTKLDSTEYWIKLKNDISFWAEFGFNDAPLTLNVDFGDTIGEKSFKYKPNPRYLIGIGGSYKGIGFTVSFRIPVNLRDEKYYGKTNYWDIQGAAQIKNFLVYGSYRNYKGFALTNLQDFDSITSDSTLLRNDISTFTINAGVVWHFFKKRYNYGCATGFAGIHSKSGWSPYANMGFTVYGVKANSGIVPREYINDSTLTIINTARTYGLRTIPGIAYILSKKGFNLSIRAGLGLIWQYNVYSFQNTNEKNDKFSIAPAMDFDLGIGYNHRFWAIRLSGTYNLYYSKFEHFKYFQNYYKVLLTIGGRIPIKKKSKVPKKKK